MSQPFQFEINQHVINGYSRAGQVIDRSAFDDPAENSYFVQEFGDNAPIPRWWNESVLTASNT